MQFLSRTGAYSLFLTGNEVVFVLSGTTNPRRRRTFCALTVPLSLLPPIIAAKAQTETVAHDFAGQAANVALRQVTLAVPVRSAMRTPTQPDRVSSDWAGRDSHSFH